MSTQWKKINTGSEVFTYTDAIDTSLMRVGNYYASLYIPSNCKLLTIRLDGVSNSEEAIAAYGRFYAYVVNYIPKSIDYTNYHSVVYTESSTADNKFNLEVIDGMAYSELIAMVNSIYNEFDLVEYITDTLHEIRIGNKHFTVKHNPCDDDFIEGYWVVFACKDTQIAVMLQGVDNDDAAKLYVEAVYPYVRLVLGRITGVNFIRCEGGL